MRCGTTCGEEAGGGGRRRRTQRAGERARLQVGSRARGGAHEEHAVRARDAGGVKVQRLVEHRRGLPRVEGRACSSGRGAGREAGGGGRPRRKRSVQGRRLDCRLGAGHGEERAQNMDCTVVTLEVSKLSGWLNFAAYCRESKGGHMMRGEVRAGRREAAGDRGASAACRGEGSTVDWEQGTGRSAL